MGPCLCGDPYCPSCGNPGLAKLEAAEEWTMERLHKAKLSPDEYQIVVRVGLAAVQAARRAVKQYQDHQRFLAEEERSLGPGYVPGWADQS